MKHEQSAEIIKALARIEAALGRIEAALSKKGKAAGRITHRLPKPPPPDEPEPAAG